MEKQKTGVNLWLVANLLNFTVLCFQKLGARLSLNRYKIKNQSKNSFDTASERDLACYVVPDVNSASFMS